MDILNAQSDKSLRMTITINLSINTNNVSHFRICESIMFRHVFNIKITAKLFLKIFLRLLLGKGTLFYLKALTLLAWLLGLLKK